jgi:3-hydroxybutyryl-CoA dehydrogenase
MTVTDPNQPFRAAVVGAGTMGSGIAITTIRAGLPTLLFDANGSALEPARERIASFLARGVERGKATQAEADAALARLELTQDIERFEEADIVIEAVFEDLGIKQELLARLDGICRQDTVFASNTSTLSITRIAAGSSLPERVVGMHFCNPAPLMPLVEVVRGYVTGDATLERATDFVRSLGKREVIVADVPGFIVNRYLVPFENDCIRMLEAGHATIEEIDLAVTAGLGHPMGPFTLLDTVGLDIHKAVSMSLFEQLRDPRFAVPPLVERMIAAGHLGRKTGQGFYSYERSGMFGA